MERALTSLSLREVSERIAGADVSPVEVVDATLRRIGELDPKLRAFISVAGDTARVAAQAAERLVAAGYRIGPLHGVPLGLKDNVAVRGQVTTAGSKLLADSLPAERDATIAGRLRAAGAILIGRLNMHELAYGVTTDNPHYGTARNPWDTNRSPGGSSGGSGAAVAARLCYGAIGTDTGCSIRLPAAYNGVTGIRPSIGRVSNHGIIPLAWTLDTAGPLCRSAEDCALMLGVIAGHDRHDQQMSSTIVPDYVQELDRGPEGLKIALVRDFSLSGVHKDVRVAVTAAVEQLEGAGAQICEVTLHDLEPSVSALLTVDIAEPAAYHAEWLRTKPELYGDDVRTLLEAGELYLATHYIQAQRYRTVIRNQIADVFRQVDAIITPTVPFTAPPVGGTTVRLDSGDELDLIPAVMRYNALPPLTGMPALSVPCGFATDGLPIGMQIMGDAFDEATILRIGHAYQQITDWHSREPQP